MNRIISHIRPHDGPLRKEDIQTNEEHSLGVANLAKEFASEFGMGEWGYVIGMLHDKGKEKLDFQNYIRKVNGIEADSYNDKTHAYIGALLAKELFPKYFPLMSFPIDGHHGGLCNYNDLDKGKVIPNEINREVEVPCPQMPKFKSLNPRDFNHLVRMIYSCLVDADFLDTEAFMNHEKAQLRQQPKRLEDLLPLLENHLSKLFAGAPLSKVNEIRAKVQMRCREASEDAPGVHSLTVPTGGGKTLSSLLWAILHAVRHNKKRIIIAIPYTSIISQTAKVLKEIFGDENVLEHHSNLVFEEGKDRDAIASQKLASENWDAPIIVTTNVRLFESMYSNKPSVCRRLHNICNSVIILDEAQMLPGERLQPIVDALKSYVDLFRISVLFTTASQPTLEGKRKGSPEDLIGFPSIKEIIPKEWRLHVQLRRVVISEIQQPLEYGQIAERIEAEDRVLCIVNTRKDAMNIFSLLPNEQGYFHLSRMMCPEHVDSTITKIEEALKGNDSVKVVTTQLIEAGVDIDFPFVMRQEAGLDSVLQAAGRCNREGKMAELGKTLVFEIKDRRLPSGTLTFANNARKDIMPIEDYFDPAQMSDYFVHYYYNLPTFDKKDKDGENIASTLYTPSRLRFKDANDLFHLIENSENSIVVNFGKSKALVERFKTEGPSRSLFRQLGRYVVNVNAADFGKLDKAGFLEKLGDSDLYYMADEKQYDNRFGLKIDNHWNNETIIL